ncbi:hypothetical protein O6H91_04G095800 [Diphasiastrum complanatum]|uniref:Uncharacterized protein n=1 Tax=Diphasiastrum complanatum TaxID=34168 RepID=A0ACC2DZV2_DIPCM|nr:hypothetical protein O6H91_04G095800 [Diphasiastrum complanatum]
MAASNFTHWEVDPFFSAAEEVQNSADRMESTFRSWRHMKESAELASNSSSETFRRDLTTAIDTVKWQLEEFQRAVQVSTAMEPLYLGEAPSRHRQFVKAIWRQVSLVEKELWPTEARDNPRAVYTKIKGKENDYLAEFLSGSRVTGCELKSDNRVSLLEYREQKDGIFNTPVKAFCSKEVGDISLAMQSNTDTLRAKKLLEDCHFGGPENDKILNGFQHKEEESCPFGIEHESMNGSLCAVNGRENGWLLNSRHDCGSTRNESSVKAGVDHVTDIQVPESVGNGPSLWGLWKGKKSSLWLQLSKSGFKRWKDGDASLADESEDATPLLTIPVLKNGYNSRPGNHRKSTNGLVPSEIDCSEVKNPNGGREAAQMPLRTQQSFSFGQAFHLVFGMLIVISFVSFYFWFLSTIVPTENKTVVPGHFPN